MVALIVSTTIVELLVVAIVLVALMVVAILVVTMLLVAQFMATHGRKMSCFFFWLLFVLGDLLKNASRFVGRLTLVEEKGKFERVYGHRLVCIRELKLMRLGLRKED
jgi:hypothetical protein